MKRLEPALSDDYELDVLECSCCGFHIGFDVSYLDQVGEIQIPCPSCGEEITTDFDGEEQ